MIRSNCYTFACGLKIISMNFDVSYLTIYCHLDKLSILKHIRETARQKLYRVGSSALFISLIDRQLSKFRFV